MNLSVKAKLCLFVLFLTFFYSLFVAETPAQRRSYTASTDARVSTSNFDSNEQLIFDLINLERSRTGLGELNWDARLSELARAYSEKMARENFFGHHDRSGESVDGRARNMRIKNWSKIGENLFFSEGYDSPNRLAVRGWMKSPTHRDNIFDPSYTDSGIGIAQSADGRIYITQVFIER